MKITVIGSLNIDHYHFVRALPKPGETVVALRTQTSFGGKGANQAVAAARSGSEVSMIGMLGEDASGDAYLAALEEEGIDTSAILRTAVQPTGTAAITVDESGENTITVHAGANACLSPLHIEGQQSLIESSAAILLQFESPMETVIRASEIASGAGVPVFLNPSPMPAEIPWERLRVDSVIVNETEHSRLPAGLKARIIVTRGAGPTTLTDSNRFCECPAFEVTPVDTVGAGDTFAGAIVTALSQKASPEEALRFGNAAGALATLRAGAQDSIPHLDDILKKTGGFSLPAAVAG